MSDAELLALCDHIISSHEEADIRGVVHPYHERETVLARALKARLREGWVLVPEEPNIDMLMAGLRVSGCYSDADLRIMHLEYRAMLAAVPKD